MRSGAVSCVNLDGDSLADPALASSPRLGSFRPGESLHRDEAAEILDRSLRKLSRREARARLILGRIADAFLRRSAHNQLSFARLSDYSRERLGLSASEVYELARVAREASRLPALAAAFERGEIGWTKLREITAVARSDTQAEWLELARQYTADGLTVVARRMKESARATDSLEPENPAGMPGLSAAEHAAVCEDEIDGEPAGVLRIPCPRHVQRLWHRARELARRMAGSDVPDWEAAEAIAAEALSQNPCSSRFASHDASIGGHLARPMLGAAIEPRASRQQTATTSASLIDLLEPRTGDDGLWNETHETTDAGGGCCLHPAGDEGVLYDEGLPYDPLTRLADDAYAADAHQLDGRMRTVLAAIQLVDSEIGDLLRACCALRLHQDFGYRSVASYARNRLGMSSRKARGLLAIERKSPTVSSELMRAYREGRLSWYRTLMLLPLVCEENAEAWIERACSVTARQLRDQLEWAMVVRGNARSAILVMPPAPGGVLTAASRECPACGVEHDLRELSAAAAVTLDATDTPAALEARRQIRGHDGARCIALECPAASSADVDIRIRGPMTVISLLCDALEAHTRPSEPAWYGFQRMLVHVIEYWESAAKHRDPIFARDGWRCAAPGCSSRRNLHDHHIRFRSRLGGGEQDNRITLCAWHHLRGIHAGTMRVTGLVSQGLTWEMGLAAGKPPLFRCVGEEYLEPPRRVVAGV